MALKTDAVGKSWPGFEYEIGREKIREYCHVLGIENAVHFDKAAANLNGAMSRQTIPTPTISPSGGSSWHYRTA